MKYSTSNEFVEKIYTLNFAGHNITFDVVANPTHLRLFELFLNLADYDISKDVHTCRFLFDKLDKEDNKNDL